MRAQHAIRGHTKMFYLAKWHPSPKREKESPSVPIRILGYYQRILRFMVHQMPTTPFYFRPQLNFWDPWRSKTHISPPYHNIQMWNKTKIANLIITESEVRMMIRTINIEQLQHWILFRLEFIRFVVLHVRGTCPQAETIWKRINISRIAMSINQWPKKNQTTLSNMDPSL